MFPVWGQLGFPKLFIFDKCPNNEKIMFLKMCVENKEVFDDGMLILKGITFRFWVNTLLVLAKTCEKNKWVDLKMFNQVLEKTNKKL